MPLLTHGCFKEALHTDLRRCHASAAAAGLTATPSIAADAGKMWLMVVFIREATSPANTSHKKASAREHMMHSDARVQFGQSVDCTSVQG
jgi:hypothetical protein